MVHVCEKCSQFGLNFEKKYKPEEFIEGKTSSQIWIIGINPSQEPEGGDQRGTSDLRNHFINTKRNGKFHRYFEHFRGVSELLYYQLGEEQGVAHTDLVKCASSTWPPQGVTRSQPRVIVRNCQEYLRAQIVRYRPTLVICNGIPTSEAMLELFPPVRRISNTAYLTTVESHCLYVVQSGFVGRNMDNYSKRRLGQEIESLLDTINGVSVEPCIRAEFRKQISIGKYSRWATDINEDRLVMLIQAVDAYATAVNKAQEKTGVNDTASLISVRQHERVKQALDILVQIHAGKTVDYRMPSGWDQEFDDDKVALPESTRRRLKSLPSSAWAESISERNLALLFWMAEEFSARNAIVSSQPDEDSNQILLGLAAIHQVVRDRKGAPGSIRKLVEKRSGRIE